MNDNPLGREYSRAEMAAARRVGIEAPMFYATGDYHPNKARQLAKDWALIADAMEREWARPRPSGEEAE